jgi:hypothetical protein
LEKINNYIAGMLRLFLISLILCITSTAFSQKEALLSNKKISYTLQQIIIEKKVTDTVQVSFSVASVGDIKRLSGKFPLKSASEKIAVTRIAVRDLQRLLQDTSVLFINTINIPKEELTTGINDLATNRINYAHHIFPSVNGDSINVSVKERLFDTTDIDLKGRVFKTGLEHSSPTPHASLMATIMGGLMHQSSHHPASIIYFQILILFIKEIRSLCKIILTEQ